MLAKREFIKAYVLARAGAGSTVPDITASDAAGTYDAILKENPL